MGQADHLKLGDYNVICDICHGKFKRSKTQLIRPYAKAKPSLLVCRKCEQTPNPQDFVKGVPDNQVVPLARPDREVDGFGNSNTFTWEDF